MRNCDVVWLQFFLIESTHDERVMQYVYGFDGGWRYCIMYMPGTVCMCEVCMYVLSYDSVVGSADIFGVIAFS